MNAFHCKKEIPIITHLRRVFTASVFVLLVLIGSCARDTGFSIQKSTHYNSLFGRNSGWTGADGAYSVPLSDKKILWLFGDTWVGKIRNNKHVDSTLINNSVAIQYGKDPVNASIDFFFHQTPEGKPEALIKPADGNGWIWIYHGLMLDNHLYLFLVQINRAGGRSEPGFKIIGTWLGHVQNPNSPPNLWKIHQFRIPWENIHPAGDTIFGSFVLCHNGFVYIYGTSEDIVNGRHHKYMILARVRLDNFPQFDKWRFFSNGTWTKDYRSASRLCGGIANEYSVSFLPIVDKFAVVYSPNSVSENIMIRLAPEPYGPWSDPLSLYSCPEVKWDKDIYCYAAKAHPALTSKPDELIITYVASSTDFWKMAGNARLYRPRFIRIKLTDAHLSSLFE